MARLTFSVVRTWRASARRRRCADSGARRVGESARPAPHARQAADHAARRRTEPAQAHALRRRLRRRGRGRRAQRDEWQPGDAVFGSRTAPSPSTPVCRPATAGGEAAEHELRKAAASPIAGLTALQALRDGEGADGPGADQRRLGRGRARSRCRSRRRSAPMSPACAARATSSWCALGADQVIDYTREDFTARSERYDVFIDNMSNHSLLACRRVLTPRGRYVMVGGPTGGWINPLPRALAALVVSSSQARSCPCSSPAPASGTWRDWAR